MILQLTPDQLAVTITALDDYVAAFEEGRGLEDRVDAARSVLAALRAQRAPAQPAMPEPSLSLEEAAADALEWIDEIYPPDIFDGSSGDEGPVRIVAIRENLRTTLRRRPPAE